MPKGTDLNEVSPDDLRQIERKINGRPERSSAG